MLVYVCVVGEDITLVSWDKGLADSCLNSKLCDAVIPKETDLSYDEIAELLDNDELSLDML